MPINADGIEILTRVHRRLSAAPNVFLTPQSVVLHFLSRTWRSCKRPPCRFNFRLQRTAAKKVHLPIRVEFMRGSTFLLLAPAKARSIYPVSVKSDYKYHISSNPGESSKCVRCQPCCFLRSYRVSRWDSPSLFRPLRAAASRSTFRAPQRACRLPPKSQWMLGVTHSLPAGIPCSAWTASRES